MSFANFFRTRNDRRLTSRKRPTAKPRLERLEDRLALSGFGPEDGAYIVEPWQGNYRDVQVQTADQKIVAAGNLYDETPGLAVARYDAVGNPDAAYGSGGVAAPAIGFYSTALSLQPDGKAVVVGSNDGPNNAIGVARLNTNGSLDNSFGNSGGTLFDVQSGADGAYGVGLQANGKIVAAGFSSSAGVVARFTASGAIDSGRSGFGDIVKGKARGYTLNPAEAYGDVAIQPDDKVVTLGGTAAGLRVARYTPAGALDTTFNGSGFSVIVPSGSSGKAVSLQSDGKIVVAGSATGIDGSADMLVARYNSNGTLDTGFGGGSGFVRLDVDGTVSATREFANDVTIQPDGKIVVVGHHRLTPLGNPVSVLVFRLDTNGTPDATFAPGGFKLGSPPVGPDVHSFVGEAVALQSDGSIIVAGTDNQGTTTAVWHPLLMRFLGASTAPAAAESSTTSSDVATDAALMLLLGDDSTTLGRKK